MNKQRNLYLKILARWYRNVMMYIIPDKKYLSNKFVKANGVRPNLENPQLFSEKLLYLMLHYRNPLATICSDKYYVNEYLKSLNLDSIIRPIFGVYKNVGEIDFEELPDEFFIKCNHVSGNNMIINKKNNLDIAYLDEFYSEVMKLDYYTSGREFQYHNIRPLIICEPCLRDQNGNLPIDYKFYCFGGRLKYFMVSCGEFEHKIRNHKFDRALNSVDHYFKKESTLSEEEARKMIPYNINDMFRIADKLSKPFPHVRVDLYNLDGKIYFGELTFSSNGGIVSIYNEEYDKEIGSWINLKDYKRDFI